MPSPSINHLWVFSLPEARWQLTKPKEVPLKRKETPTAPLFPAGMRWALSSGATQTSWGGPQDVPSLWGTPHPIPTQRVGNPCFHTGGVDVADAPLVLRLHQHHNLDAPEALQGNLWGGTGMSLSAPPIPPHGQAQWGWRSSKAANPSLKGGSRGGHLESVGCKGFPGLHLGWERTLALGVGALG